MDMLCSVHYRELQKKKSKYIKKKGRVKKNKVRLKKKPKKRTLPDLRKELWFWTSLLVRLHWSDDDGYGTCIVRGTRHYYWKDGANAGHMVRKSAGGITKFMFENIFFQSAASNIAEEQYLMGQAIRKLHEEGKTKYCPDTLIKMNKTIPFKDNRLYLETTIEDYRKRVFELAKQKNLWEWKENCLKKYLK